MTFECYDERDFYLYCTVKCKCAFYSVYSAAIDPIISDPSFPEVAPFIPIPVSAEDDSWSAESGSIFLYLNYSRFREEFESAHCYALLGDGYEFNFEASILSISSPLSASRHPLPRIPLPPLQPRSAGF